MTTKCDKHPRYKGAKPPKCQCKQCVIVYMHANGLEKVLEEASYCANILFNYRQCIGKTLNADDAELMKEHQTKFDQAWAVFNKNVS